MSKLRVLGAICACIIPIVMSSSSYAALVSIDFDSLPGMNNIPGTTVPLASQLSDQLLSTTGASFSSAAGYVAVVALSPGQTTVSMPNVIGGVNAAGGLSYGTDVTISFFDPSNPATKGITDYISIRGDTTPLAGATATMEAFDILGNSLGSVTAVDSVLGLTLAFTQPGIHSVRVSQNSAFPGSDGSIGLDNLEFNTVQAVPLPGALLLFTSGLAFFVLPNMQRIKTRFTPSVS